MNITSKNPELSRRAFLTASLASAAGLLLPSIARSEEAVADRFSDMSVGEYLREFSPETYEKLGTELKSLLDSSPMYSQPATPRTSIQQNVSISAWRAGSGAVGYSFSFTCSPYCPSLYALVTVTNLASGVSRSSERWGSGTALSGSGTAYGLGTGECRAVVTAFAPEPPAGMSSYYSQDWYTVYL